MEYSGTAFHAAVKHCTNVAVNSDQLCTRFGGRSVSPRPKRWVKRVLRPRRLLTMWETWKEQNMRIFQHKLLRPSMTFNLIKEEAALWTQAGAGLGEML